MLRYSRALKRINACRWCGDALSALQDCEFVLQHSKRNTEEVEVKRISCLKKGGCDERARAACLAFQDK
jgi:hypothetical protein